MWISHVLNHVLKMKDQEAKNNQIKKDMEDSMETESDNLIKIKVIFPNEK
jgi:hypothetical protein